VQLSYQPSPPHRDDCELGWAFGFTVVRRSAGGEGPVCGGDYVDFISRVIARGAASSLTAFRPGDLHGTTPLINVVHAGLCQSSSKKALAAYQKALASKKGVVLVYGDEDGH
jgi:hypothetical protein